MATSAGETYSSAMVESNCNGNLLSSFLSVLYEKCNGDTVAQRLARQCPDTTCAVGAGVRIASTPVYIPYESISLLTALILGRVGVAVTEVIVSRKLV